VHPRNVGLRGKLVFLEGKWVQSADAGGWKWKLMVEGDWLEMREGGLGEKGDWLAAGARHFG
jgi:hypothetical protein